MPSESRDRKQAGAAQRPPAPEQLVDPGWLLRAFLGTLAAALVCGYLALGYLFTQGAWQLMLHPTHTAEVPKVAMAETIRFAPNDAGQPQLAGAWMDPQNSGRLHAYVFLICRSGDGQMGEADRRTAEFVRSTGTGALFFDYRGFGQSAPLRRPGEASMTGDAESAWRYLTGFRKLPAGRVILYGEAVGAVIAARVAAAHPDTAALVLRDADAKVFSRVLADPRGRIFPVRLLLRDRFSLDEALSEVHAPKLLISTRDDDRARLEAYTRAEGPKVVLHLQQGSPADDLAQEREALLRFAGDRLAP